MPRFYGVTAVIQVPVDWDEAAVRAFMERQVLSGVREKASLCVAELAPPDAPAVPGGGA